MVTMEKTEVRQAGECCGYGEKVPWLYWHYTGHGCGYSGVRMADSAEEKKVKGLYIEMETK